MKSWKSEGKQIGISFHNKNYWIPAQILQGRNKIVVVVLFVLGVES